MMKISLIVPELSDLKCASNKSWHYKKIKRWTGDIDVGRTLLRSLCTVSIITCFVQCFSSPNKNCIHLNTVMLNFNPLAMNHVLSRHKTHAVNDERHVFTSCQSGSFFMHSWAVQNSNAIPLRTINM